MGKAKKLPSGSWRARAYSYTDSQGKQHYESFTAPTKQQAELLASQFSASNERNRAQDYTLYECIENYINANEAVLSPSTIYNYRKELKRIAPIANVKIRKINSSILQNYISGLAAAGKSPKTIHNSYGLIHASLAFAGVKTDFMIHLPSVVKKRKYAPSDEVISVLFQAAKPKMQRAIMLGCHSLRRGEISALKYRDLVGNKLYVHSDMVIAADGRSWVHKEIPKTEASTRVIYLADKEVELLGSGHPDEYIVPLVPSSIGTNFFNLKQKTGVNIRFHDLRVYFSSLAVALQIPNTTAASLGGWRQGSQVLTRVYQNSFVSADEAGADLINKHLENLYRDIQEN